MITLRNPETGEQVAVPETELVAPEGAPEGWFSAYEGWEQVADQAPHDDEAVLADGQWYVPLQVLKGRAWARTKAERAERLLLAPTDFGQAQSDLESRTNISGLVSMASIAKQRGASFAEVFTLADNSTVVLNADQMILFGVQVGTHVAQVYARARELRLAIEAAETVEDLDLIDTTAGWPAE